MNSHQFAQVSDSCLLAGIDYLKRFTEWRLRNHFGEAAAWDETYPAPHDSDLSSFARFVRQYEPTHEELIVLLTALVPHIVPGFFDQIAGQFFAQGAEFPEFGGVKGKNHRGLLPTGETALFLLAGANPEARLRMLPVFQQDQFLFKNKILFLGPATDQEPQLSGRLCVEPEFVEVFTTGRVGYPRLSIQFPAQHITTQTHWNDLVLNDRIWQQIGELESWIKHQDRLMTEWKMGSKLKPGYRVLFYGPPGTGKTLTATLLGKYTGREVFKIDLSMVVSKFIGETEKNLASLFDKAEHKDWILFFDEADAIFGKRTGVRDAHDKYANQEVSYLLQRIEAHPGLVILASNFRSNMDEAFVRRFNSIIYFPPPSVEERLRLWRQSFPAAVRLGKDVDLEAIAAAYELTGAHIMNVVQYLCLSALEKGTGELTQADLLRGIRRELEKEGK